MTRVKDFRVHLGRMVREDRTISDALRADLYGFLAQISAHDDMELSAFFDLFKSDRTKRSDSEVPRVGAALSVPELASELRASFDSDARFDSVLSKLHADKAVTKAILVKLYEELFGSAGGIPKRAKRADLLQLIADERLVTVRNSKAMDAMRRHPVPAE